jgi:hypothetical protein
MLGPPLAMRLPLSWSRASAQLPALCCCPADSADMQATRPTAAPDAAAAPPLAAAVSLAGVRRRSQMRTAPSPLPAKRLCSPSMVRLHWWPPPPWVSVAVQPGARPSQRQIVRPTLPLAILSLPRHAEDLPATGWQAWEALGVRHGVTRGGGGGGGWRGEAGMGLAAWGALGCTGLQRGCRPRGVAQPCAHAAQGRAVPQAHAQVVGATHLHGLV